MSGQNRNKLNQLLRAMPEGAAFPSAWLNKKGIYRQLIDRYVRSGWMERLANGVYIRSGTQTTWSGGLYGLQQGLNIPVFAGAFTALDLNGLGHFLPLGKGETIYLFSNGYQRLPAWFLNHDWSVDIKYYAPKLFSKEVANSNVSVKVESLSIMVSSPEKAFLESLYLAKSNEDIDFCIQLMAGLSTLIPSLLQELLENCTSIKVKRLFLWLAENAGHPWFKHLNIELVNTGRGKRYFYRGGVFNKKYHITVPPKEEMPVV